MSGSVLLQRNAGSSSDGTEDSDFSTDPEHTDSSESDGTSRRSARVTRSSARLSQSSQGKGFVFLNKERKSSLLNKRGSTCSIFLSFRREMSGCAARGGVFSCLVDADPALQ